MLFDLSNYWIFVMAVAAIYALISNYAQNNVGGKGRLKSLQVEMRDIQKKMTDSAKSKNEKELNDAISQNWKLTMEIMQIQMKMFVVLIGLLFIVAYIFPMFEPGTSDDVHMPLFDDGLAAHCDAMANDGNFSNCYALPANGTRGAWAVDVFLISNTSEHLARGASAIYYDGGKPEDIWLQSSSQSGFLDGIMGKVAYHVNATTGRQNYSTGETVAVHAFATPAKPAGVSFDAVFDSGTFFYVDLPFPLPLLNIRRIIGSYGFFILSAFVLSLAYSIIKSVYSNISKPKKA